MPTAAILDPRSTISWPAGGAWRSMTGCGGAAAPRPVRPTFSTSPAVKYPKIVRVRQHFQRPRVPDVAQAVTDALEKLDLGQRIRPGQSVALTAGSRGIANIPLILKATASFLKKIGAKPFLIPAM